MRVKLKQKAILGCLFISSMLTCCIAGAAGFSLYTETSASAIGNYAAGIAAEGADASIGWYNPAGLVLIKEQQVVISGVGIVPSSQLNGSSTFFTENPLGSYVQSFQNVQGGNSAFVPSIHYALPLGERAAFGLNLIAPVGLATNFPKTSPIRYAGILSEFESFNLAGELGGKITDHLAIGAGLDLQYALEKFTGALGAPTLMSDLGLPPTTLDSESNNTGSSYGFGFHAGLLFMFHDNHTRIGLNYQSAIGHVFDGYSQLTGRLADPQLNIYHPLGADPGAHFRADNLYSNSIDFPSILTLSGYQDISEKWALLGSVVFTGWSSVQNIVLNNVAVGVPVNVQGDVIQTTTKTLTPEDFIDAWRFAIGANYHVNEKWMIRTGGAYDQTPTTNAARSVRIPDSSLWALAIGSHYQLRNNLGFDIGYSYVFASSDPPINKTTALDATTTYNVNARVRNHGQLFALQAVWTLDKGEVARK